jgi:Fibronectin type III domain
MRRIGVVAAVLGALASLGFAPPSSAEKITSSWCSDGASTPCVESATLNGGAITSTDPNWDVFVQLRTPGGSHTAYWLIENRHGGGLTMGDDWVVTIDMGTIIPRVAWAHGDDFSITRHDDGDGTWTATVAATPVVIVGECDQTVWPWTCPTTATQEWDGYLDGEVTDYDAWSDATQRDSMYGLDFATNVAATSLPPEIVPDPVTGDQQILIRLANPHFLMDGTTVFHGFVHQRIPNAFLAAVYGIDAPATLTTGGLVPVVSGPTAGSGTASVTDGGTAMLVDITDLTFSRRLVRINRGVITPTRPTGIAANRLGPHSGRVWFHTSTPRGSRIVGYTARCVKGTHVFTATGSAAPITVTGLTRGVGYQCSVKARSKAGASAWSTTAGMPAHA